MKENLKKEKTKKFAIRIVRFFQFLQDERKEYVMSKQILKSGTSIGANVYEAIYAESPADFIHKYAIAQKECSETIYWLELLHDTNYMTDEEFSSLNYDCIEIMRLLTSTILSLKKKQGVSNP